MGLRGKLMNSLCILFTDNNMHYLGLYICMEWAWWNIKKLFYYILRLFYCGMVQKVKWEIWLKPFIPILISFLCTVKIFPLGPTSMIITALGLWDCWPNKLTCRSSNIATFLWLVSYTATKGASSPFTCLLSGKEKEPFIDTVIMF